MNEDLLYRQSALLPATSPKYKYFLLSMQVAVSVQLTLLFEKSNFTPLPELV